MIELYEHELRIDEKALEYITDEEVRQVRSIAKKISQRAEHEKGVGKDGNDREAD